MHWEWWDDRVLKLSLFSSVPQSYFPTTLTPPTECLPAVADGFSALFSLPKRAGKGLFGHSVQGRDLTYSLIKWQIQQQSGFFVNRVIDFPDTVDLPKTKGTQRKKAVLCKKRELTILRSTSLKYILSFCVAERRCSTTASPESSAVVNNTFVKIILSTWTAIAAVLQIYIYFTNLDGWHGKHL